MLTFGSVSVYFTIDVDIMNGPKVHSRQYFKLITDFITEAQLITN